MVPWVLCLGLCPTVTFKNSALRLGKNPTVALLVNRSPLNLRALKPSVPKATCRTITMVSAVIGVWALAFVSGYRPGSSCRTLAEVPYDNGGFCRIV